MSIFSLRFFLLFLLFPLFTGMPSAVSLMPPSPSSKRAPSIAKSSTQFARSVVSTNCFVSVNTSSTTSCVASSTSLSANSTNPSASSRRAPPGATLCLCASLLLCIVLPPPSVRRVRSRRKMPRFVAGPSTSTDNTSATTSSSSRSVESCNNSSHWPIKLRRIQFRRSTTEPTTTTALMVKNSAKGNEIQIKIKQN
jgi:hypothetical protein